MHDKMNTSSLATKSLGLGAMCRVWSQNDNLSLHLHSLDCLLVVGMLANLSKSHL